MRPKVAQHRNPSVGVAVIETAYREIRSMIRLDIEFGIDEVVAASPTVARARTRSAGTTTILVVRLAWGTDTLFDPGLAEKQGKQLTKLKRWFSPYEVLKMATHDNAQLLKLCDPRDPYPGDLGVVAEGALADLVLVDGNTFDNIDLIADPHRNFAVIMKDGQIYKNTLDKMIVET